MTLRLLTRFIFISLVFLTHESCKLPDFSSQYAIASVKLPTGQQIYFKREVRGITGNYDVIAISTNNDPCKSYDEKMDYRIYSYDKFGNYIYYKMEGDKLHLYGVVANNSPTEEFPLNLKIENHEINFLEWEKFEGNYDKQGITRLLLGIKPENKCR
jgi:hypothetical protein